MATWKSLAKRRSKIRQMFAIWIHKRFRDMARLRAEDKKKLDAGIITQQEYEDLIEKDHADAFTLREIMDAHGMDYDSRADYTKAYTALAQERKEIEGYFELFVNSDELNNARKMGKSDDDIWRDFLNASNSWNIHLLYCDDDGRYKQIDMFSYSMLVNRRLKAMDMELRTKAEQIKLIGKELPSLIPNLKPPELDGIKDRHRMLVAHAWSCPYCPDLAFPDDNELKKHLEIVHKFQSNGHEGSPVCQT